MKISCFLFQNVIGAPGFSGLLGSVAALFQTAIDGVSGLVGTISAAF